MNKKLILTLVGAVTASTIVFYSYKAYKMYKHIKAEEITAEEVMKVIEERKLKQQAEETAKALAEREALKDISLEEYDVAYEDETLPLVQYEYEEYLMETLPLVQYEYEEYLMENGEVEETYEEEEEEELDILRYEPNSLEAKDQYMMLLLSDFDRYSRDYVLLSKLLRVPFSGDPEVNEILLENIWEIKAHFYGPESKWLDVTSWGDVIIYFADRASFDLGNTRDYWFGMFMDTIGFATGEVLSDQEFDEIVDSLCNNYFYGVNYGIFGLSRDQVLEAGRIDAIEHISQLSIERQYQEYVKQELEDM